MAKIIAPNMEYTGVSASVPFCNGVGETDNAYLIEWFQSHGYEVQEKIKVEHPENTELPKEEDEKEEETKQGNTAPPKKPTKQ